MSQFKIISKIHVPEFKIDCTLSKHLKTNASLLTIDSLDSNNVFKYVISLNNLLFIKKVRLSRQFLQIQLVFHIYLSIQHYVDLIVIL